MNVKNNRLNRETDEKIIRTVYAMMTQQHRPIGKITVREICEEAGVHRSTFYAHYQDVYDLVEKVEQNMSRQLTERFFRKLDENAPARDCLPRFSLSSASTGSFTSTISRKADNTASCS